MRKKISVCLLACLLLFSAASSVAAETDGRLTLLRRLEIMEGYEDGSFRLENFLTRAEFTKVAVAASQSRKLVSTALSTSPFPDVPHTLWSAPYIKLAAQNGYVTGYLDATFRPDATITYAEATAVFLRLLGYQNSDFGTAWPRGHMEIAEDIGLTDGIVLDYAAPITRGDTVTLLYNLLDGTVKGTGQKYVSLLGCTAEDNVVIRATSEEDTSISSSKVLTSLGTFKKGKHFSSDWVGRTGRLFVENGDTVCAFVPNTQTVSTFTVTDVLGGDLLLDDNIYNWADSMPIYYKSAVTTYGKAYTDAKKGCTLTVFYDSDGAAAYGLLRKTAPKDTEAVSVRTYAVYSVLQDGVITYKNGQMEKVTLADGLPLYKDSVLAGTFQKSALRMGDILRVVYDEDGDAEYISLDTEGVDGPYTAQNGTWQSRFPINDATVIMRDSQKVSASEIQTHDILYYSEALNMVLAYTDKVTGVYTNASPSKDAPTTANVSGTSYAIESVEAFHKLAAGGTFAFGDTVTLLLGREGGIADVLTPGDTGEVVGFVTDVGTKGFETALGESYTAYFLTLTRPQGQSVTFETDSEYTSLLNRVVSVTFTGGKARATRVDTSSLLGTFSLSSQKLGSESLAANLKILDTYAPDPYTGGSTVSVFPARLDGVHIPYGKVLYAARDAQNRICELILDDMTGDMHAFGVVTKAATVSSGLQLSGTYSYIIDGNTGTYQTNGSAFSVYSDTPAQFMYSGGRLHSIQPLSVMPGTIREITNGTLLYADGSRYDISEAAIYTKVDVGVYVRKKASDIAGGDYTIRAYYDRSPAAGGKIRILIATKKIK